MNKMQKILGPPTEKSWEEGVNKMKRMNFRLLDSSPGEPSQDELGESEKAESAIRKILPRDTSPVAAKLIHQMISWNPSTRPSSDEMLEHEYFQSSEAPKKLTSKGNVTRSEIVVEQRILGSGESDQHIYSSSARKPKKRALKQSERYRSFGKQDHRPHANDDGVEPREQPHRHRHKISEIVVEQRNLGSGKGGQHISNASARKSKAPPWNLSKKIPGQPENEFCQYLNAFSNSHDGRRSDSYKPSGNKIRPIFPGKKQDAEQMPNPFHQSLEDIMPTPSARRNRIAQAKNTGMNDCKSARKSTRKPKHHSRHSHYVRAVEKHRRLLSYQNMGKRAMEVSMSRPTHLAIDESAMRFTMAAVMKTRVNQT
mmetsp:Transcript_14318/g.26020  ORF Transcript_14318/g.26020 Transcript_14318/m.26020 type:complete len:369 (+) Transcript_14318:1144-2250(+)